MAPHAEAHQDLSAPPEQPISAIYCDRQIKTFLLYNVGRRDKISYHCISFLNFYTRLVYVRESILSICLF